MASASSSIVENSAAGVLSSASPVATAENAQMRLELEKVKEQMLKLQLRLDESGREKKEVKKEERAEASIAEIRDFERLTKEELEKTFFTAAETGQLLTVEGIISCSRFKDIPAGEERFSLAGAFIGAACKGHLQCLKAIVACNRFTEIPSGGSPASIAGAFVMAAFEDQIQCLQEIIACKRFKDIPTSGEASLETAFTGAVGKGNIRCVEAVITSPRSGELDDLEQPQRLPEKAELFILGSP